MNRKSFSIPVGWPTDRIPGRPPLCTVRLNSNTLVLSLTATSAARRGATIGVKLDAPFEVERIPGSWSKHIPEKKPRYRVSTYDWRDWHIDLEPVRLHLVSSGREILVPLIARRPQTCFVHKDKLHGIYFNRDGTNPYTFCGLAEHINTATDWHLVRSRYVDDAIPTCPACLEYRAVWCFFSVFEYESKREALKRVAKVKSVEEKRLQLPTAYARILDDDLFENPSYKPASRRRAQAVLDYEEQEVEDEFVDPRESKRATALDRSRRLEESKAQVQGHRRR